MLNKHGQWPKKDIIDAGAHIAGCNTQTTRRYLDPLTSSAGPFKERKDEMGNVMITFRE